ncbi:MAG: apolipoprotein N-acyltransferase, partial [Planctomycetes bacterium]|nr:apolipoprotein N-acyltransferase [Planctomycetota bacterium]
MEAAAAEKPDLYLLPESPWTMVLNPEARDFLPLSRRSHAVLQAHATKHDATVVTGSGTILPTPFDPGSSQRRHNSATVFYADGSKPDRYDKVHLVHFGEIIPFRFGRLRFLYFWLNRLVPWSGEDGNLEFSLFPGESFKTFTLTAPSLGGRTYDFGIPICYEDVMPYVSREFVSGGAKRKRVDLLLNISNDGWFGRGIQQPQHIAICAFRAVENRVGIARAVNTGVSGFVEPSGRIHDIVEGDPSNGWPGIVGYSVATLGVDSRYTLYSRFGDWFGWGCAFMWLVFFVDYWIVRVRASRDERKAEASE